MRTALYVTVVVWALILVAALGGCANPTGVRLDDDANASRFTATNQARHRTTADGPVMDISTLSAPPTTFQLDDQGVWAQTTGQGATLNLPGFGQVWTPNDAVMKGVQIFGPDGKAIFAADELSINVSDQAALWAAQLSTVVQATQGMTQTEANRYVASLEQAGKIATEVAALARDIYIPRLPAPTE